MELLMQKQEQDRKRLEEQHQKDIEEQKKADRKPYQGGGGSLQGRHCRAKQKVGG